MKKAIGIGVFASLIVLAIIGKMYFTSRNERFNNDTFTSKAVYIYNLTDNKKSLWEK